MKLNMLDINIKKYFINKEISIKEACLYMIENDLEICPVVENENILGVITKDKLFKLVLSEADNLYIENYIDKDYTKINCDDEILKILGKFEKPFLIFNKDEYIGIINKSDIRNIMKLELDVLNTYKQTYKAGRGLREILESLEKEIILNALKENNGNKQKTSKMLNMSRTKLYQKLSQYENSN